MRPLKLTLQAFGPFAERQEIDFRESLDHRLFGFYGETGGGKTSILDALCFALFGESSGQERRNDDLRSHHVGPEVETVVEFCFELGDKRYFIRRLPEQVVKARKGSGETKRPHAAYLFDATGVDVDQLSGTNPGEPLAEKVSHVEEKIGEILGYEAAQFRQVVLLPQGQFRALLVAKSDERSKILRRLFDVSLYERLVEVLKLEGQALETEVRNAREAISAQLSHHNVADIVELSALIQKSRTDKDVAEGAHTRCGAAKTRADNALHQARNVAEKFAEEVNAQTALESLEAKETEIAALEARSAQADQALVLAPLNDRLKGTVAALSEANRLLDVAKTAETTAQSKFNTASEALAESNAKASEREELVREVTRFTDLEGRVKKALPVREEAQRLKTAADAAQEAFDASDKALLATETANDKARVAEAAAQARQTRIVELVGLVNDATRDAADAKTYERVGADLNTVRRALSQAETAWNTEKATLARAAQSFANAEAALSRVQAVHLARKLVDGEACSVCGSLDHPAPATGNAESQGLNEAFEQARTAKEAAEKKERSACTRHTQAQTALESAEKNFAELKNPAKIFADAENARQTADTELTQLRAQPSPGAAAKAASGAAQKWTEARTALESARTHKDSTANAALQCAERLKLAFEGIEPKLRTEQAVSAARKDADAKAKAANEKHEAAVKAEREAEHGLVGAKAALQGKTVAQEAAARDEAETRKGLLEGVEALGWSGDDYKRAKTDIPQRGAFRQAIQEFRSKIRSARDRLARAKANIEGQVQLDLTALEQAANEAGAAALGAQEHLSRIAADLGQQQETEARCGRIKQGMEDAEARFAVVGELKAMTNGDNQYRMSLVDYAIAATFEDVLEAANSRFSRMSRGRFTLFRRTEMKDARSRAGLDIAVHDNFTDRPRDAHTLSGGESFMAALSLALGLSDVVQQRAGGIKLDVIFIDEGFGSLDDQTLDNALSTLRDLVGNNRAVGVISHVEMVKQQIQAGFEISRGSGGSRVTPRAIR